MPTTTRESPARRRILDTAHLLFYAEGIHTVGIDRIIAEAAVAKATFYHHFPAKEDLICAYLTEQSSFAREAVGQLLATEGDPREALLRIFDILGELGCGPGFRGCAFVNAAAEYPDAGHPVRQVIAHYRRWFRDVLRGLLAADGHPDPDGTADLLLIARDGLLVGAYLDDAQVVRGRVRQTVERLIRG